MSKPNDLVQGTLDLLLLKILALEPLHGWAISLRLRSISGDVLQVSEGSLYPALHKLEQEGWIKAEWKQTENNRRAKFYSLTRLGKKQLESENIDETSVKRQEAIIASMTKSERKNPKLLNGSRRRRIAAGSGTSVPDINRLLKQYQDMAGMMKKMKKLGQKGLMRHGLSALMPQGFRH